MASPARVAVDPADGPGVAVHAVGLTFSYDTPEGRLVVLDGIDFDVEAGSVVAVTGASGSGKTTLLSVLGGLDRPHAGSVVIAGHDLALLDRDEMARYRREVVGFVFQDFGLLGQLTALENVELALTFERVSRRQRRARARELLGAVGLIDRLGHRPRALSGGEKQRVAIARALANSPRLVLADEPTGNLDAAATAVVLELLMQVPAEHGSTVVVVTHDDAIAARADRRMHLADGRIVNR
ncbi:MAG: putative transport system ATP-binding protein [Actinomycetota bacterium]|jgi:putative ABC transport system ATP-binding protein|nr:putative transport system ATP-binding protein [Actinomycetota bacterium]